MFFELLEDFQKIFKEVTWPRAILILLIIGVILIVAFGYESYTGHLELSRMERTVALLERMAQLSERVVSENKKELLGSIYEELLQDLDSFVKQATKAYEVPVLVKKGLASLIPWVILASAIFLATGGASNMRTTIGGMVMAASPMIVIGAVLPVYGFWIDYVVYPFGSTILMVALIMLWDKWKKKSDNTRS